MFSLQRILGDGDRFCALFEASATEACRSVAILKAVLADGSSKPNLQQFADVRRREKQLAEETSQLLIFTSVTAMEREDVEELAEALYRIPKAVEKFAERYLISFGRVETAQFLRQFNLVERAVNEIRELTTAFRARAKLARIKQLNANIQKIESDADDVILELIGRLYVAGFDPLKRIIIKDLLELNEKVVDRCRDAGNVITRVVLKNS